MILCAVCFSVHILLVDRFSPSGVNGVELSCIQFLVAGVFSTIVAFLVETPNVQDILRSWGPILYTGLISSGVGYTLQILGQKDTPPAVASLIMSLESVFAALSGWLLLGQGMTAGRRSAARSSLPRSFWRRSRSTRCAAASPRKNAHKSPQGLPFSEKLCYSVGKGGRPGKRAAK